MERWVCLARGRLHWGGLDRGIDTQELLSQHGQEKTKVEGKKEVEKRGEVMT